MPDNEMLEAENANLKARLADAKRRLKLWRRRAKEAEAALGGELFDPSRVVWVFGTGRGGTTWLASMLAEFGARWNEPHVGALFGEFYYERAAHKRGRVGILGEPHRDLWLRHIRRMVLEGAKVRYPDLWGYLVIKEPHGTTGAPLLSEALPESRLVSLVRDPRDVVASALDAHKDGSWARERSKRLGRVGSKPSTDHDPLGTAEYRAQLYLRDVEKAKEAYEAHRGPKALMRYEDLRRNPLAELRRLCGLLRLGVSEEQLTRAVHKHSWENVPEEQKGEGKFYRKATPGGWREDLTPQQIEIVERITTPLLKEFYPE